MSMRTTRRSAVLAGFAGVTALVLAATGGCATGGGKKAPAPAVSTGAQAQVAGTVTIWSWDVAAKALKRLAPEFEAKHPGTKVDVSWRPEFAFLLDASQDVEAGREEE